MISSPKLFSSILDNLQTAIVLLDQTLALRYMNPAAETLLEFSAQRLDKTPVEHLLSENGHIPEGVIKAAQTGQRFTKRQTILRLTSPADITVDYTVTPLTDPKEWLLMEIQPLDRALKISQEEMLASSQSLSRKLVRGLAHEIKNPLGGLRGAAQLLEREYPSPEIREYTDIIISEADRLCKLVDRILGPCKTMQITPVNLHEVLEHIRKLILAETKSSLNVVTDYDPSLPDIQGDREQLVQAFLNIARNAMQAIANTEEPVITFRTRVQRQFTIGNDLHRLVFRVEIIDNGPGIPPDIAENIFFPMVTGREGGTGLGLSIAQSIIHQHRGLIRFDSRPGETVFLIYLPVGDLT